MSLINDALKRAQHAQQENPPAPPPLEFRPVEPGQQEHRRPTLILVGLALVVVLILGLGAALVWFVSQSNSGSLRVAARVADAPVAPLPPVVPPAAIVPPEPVAAAVSNPPVASVAKIEAAPTNAAPAAATIVEVVPPPALRLQGIFFNPRNPSAVLNGRTLYLGDRVNGFRVMAVSPVSVTLVSATETNVLSLSE